MLTYKKKRKNSLFGDLLVLLFILGMVFLIYSKVNYNKLEDLRFTNYLYGVNSLDLVPDNYLEYITELESLNIKKYTNPLTSYALLYKESLNLKNQINFEITNECINPNLLTKLKAYNNSKRKLALEFKNIKPYPKDLYWDEYILNLENINSNKLELEIKKLPICN